MKEEEANQPSKVENTLLRANPITFGDNSLQDNEFLKNLNESKKNGSTSSLNSTCYYSGGINFQPTLGNINDPDCHLKLDNLEQNGFLRKIKEDAFTAYSQDSPQKIFSRNLHKDSFCSFQLHNSPEVKDFYYGMKQIPDNQPIPLSNEETLPTKALHKHFPKTPENYINLLINAAVKLIEDGIHLGDLKTIKKKPKTKLGKHKSNPLPHKSNQKEELILPSSGLNLKCGNKVCPVVITKRSNLFQANFPFLNKTIWLCNLCFQAYKNGQYCYYCGIIYRKYKGTKGFNNHKTWIGCEYCSNWEHIQCEESKGVFHNLSKIIKKDKKFKYKCPTCREKDRTNSRKSSVTNDDTNEVVIGHVNKRKLEKEHRKQVKEIQSHSESNKRKIKPRNNFDESSFEIDEKFKHVRMDDEKKEWLNDIKQIMELDN